MSLVKIPCLLLAMLGLHITVTPPHPPPSKVEEAPSTSWEFILKQSLGRVILRSMCWLATIAEITVIIARSSASSRSLLNFLDKAQLVSGEIHASPAFIFSTCLSCLGGRIRYACYRELGSLFTFEMSIRKEHKLVTTGPYAYVRHPAYTGVLCAVSGFALMHAVPGSWVLSSPIGQAMAIIYVAQTSITTIGLLRRMSKEDEALRGAFGQEWEEWSHRVPFKLIPSIY